MDSTIDRHTRFDDLPEFLTVAEVQRYLDLSRNGAYGLIREGDLVPTMGPRDSSSTSRSEEGEQRLTNETPRLTLDKEYGSAQEPPRAKEHDHSQLISITR